MNQKLLLLVSIPVIILIGLVIDDNLEFGPEGYCVPGDESCNPQPSEEVKRHELGRGVVLPNKKVYV